MNLLTRSPLPAVAAAIAFGVVFLPVVRAQPAAAAVPCPSYDAGVQRGDVLPDDLEEISGVAAGHTNPDVLWTHADSGSPAQVLAISAADASLVAAYDLVGATNVDWEDIAVGPGPILGESYLYVADIGGNIAEPAKVVYRVPEPAIDNEAGVGPHPLVGAVGLSFTYPDGDRDAESLMADPVTGDLMIVSKEFGPSGAYLLPAPHAVGPVALTRIATLDFTKAPLSGILTTGGDISPSGNEILVRTYGGGFIWRRAPGATLGSALASPPCPVPMALERQGEAVGFAPDGQSYFSATERRMAGPQPLHQYVCAAGFSDLPVWAADAVTWITCSDHASGFGDNTFRPNEPITRAATARILHRIAGTPTAPDCTATLTDIPTWAQDAICWLIDQGHATGYHDNTFRPYQPITRAATARILHRIDT
jgi:hypothetical protein